MSSINYERPKKKKGFSGPSTMPNGGSGVISFMNGLKIDFYDENELNNCRY